MTRPERVRSLCLFGSTPGLKNSQAPSWIPQIQQKGLRAFLAETIRDRLPEDADPGLVTWFLDEAGRNDPAYIGKFVLLMASYDWSDEVERIRCPTLVVMPGGETVGSIENYEPFRQLPDVDMRAYDGLPHNICDAVPDRCAGDVRDVMTFASPSTGEPVGRSFDMPQTKDALEARSKMMLHWARATCGMMGRSPDFMNVTFAAWGAAADFFGEKRPEFADNMRHYVEYIREHDVTLTHALINLQRSRNPTGMFNLEEGTALEVKRETDAGIIVRGARILATLGPLSDEIAVYSPRLARHSEEHSPFAVNLSIPCSTKGLKFLCRDSFDLGRSHVDHPLGSRFEEMDCIVFFDDVLVPWERVFLLYDVERLNATPHATHSTAHSAHQGAAKNLAKCEFVLGVPLLMPQTRGNGHLRHTEERIGAFVLTTDLI